MATTATGNFVCDNSSLANFVSWGTFLATSLQSFGWLQTNDTGQVMWTGLNITAVAMSGSNMTCTYSGLTGLALATGRALTITGWTGGNTGNNGTFVITALGAGTFTAVNASGVNVASAGTGVVTKVAAAPANATGTYEVWTAADASASTTPIVIRINYGASTLVVEIQVTVGTSSNGSGTITGAASAAFLITNNTSIPNQGGTTFPCFASGNAGEIRFMMWQGTAATECIWGIERSKDTSGSVTTSYFSFLAASANTAYYRQFTILGTLLTPTELSWAAPGSTNTIPTLNFNGTTAAMPVFPLIGTIGNPMLGFASASAADVGEGATVTVSIYGGSHTYIATKLGNLVNIGKYSSNGQSGAVLMRYE